MRRTVLLLLLSLVLWGLASLAVGWMLLPDLLLHGPMPVRENGFVARMKEEVAQEGGLVLESVNGGEGRPLELWHVKRAAPKGVVVLLHGFGDDAWGVLSTSRSLPQWDAVAFTFRGRDRDPSTPCTLGGWERQDVVAVVRHLMRSGFPPNRIVIAGWSMGAGTALLALVDLEQEGFRLGGALLECPFEDLDHAARNHLRQTLGPLTPLAWLAQKTAMFRAGQRAHFDPAAVSPVRAAKGLRTPVALVTGDADALTPVEGVRRIAMDHPDLTVVAGAGHCEASGRLPGGWKAWAQERLTAWGL